MKNINFKKAGRVLCASLMVAIAASCTGRYEDYNTHPYRPYNSDMTWLTNMMALMTTAHENDSQMIDQMIGCDYGGYFAMGNNWQGTNFTTYNPANGWIDYPFNNVFTNMYVNYFEGERQTKKTGPAYAVAKIIRAIIMQKQTDMYGPIPYSKMGSGGFVTPYDSQEDVYKAMIGDITASVSTLTSYVSSNPGQKPIADFDIVYGGDFTKWIKLGNSVLLRMAVRIKSVAPDLAKTTAETAVAHQIGVITTNADNAFIAITVQNPYWKAAASWNDLRSNASIVCYMDGYSDPRTPKYFTVSTDLNYPTYIGMRTGLNMSSSQQTRYRRMSQPNFADNAPMMVMNAAEVAFLKAEGKLNSWATGTDDVKTLYERGISLSFEQHGVAGALSGYISNSTLKPAAYTDPVIRSNSAPAPSEITIAWDDSATDAIKLERLIVQKWLAIYPLGFESWADFRRTGYPKMFTAVTNLSPVSTPVNTTRMARRIKFPPSEYQSNTANINAAVTMLGGIDSQGTDLWWAKKN